MMQRARMQAFLAQPAQELSPWLMVAAAGAAALLALLVVPPLLRRRNGASAGSAGRAGGTDPAASASFADDDDVAPLRHEQRSIEREIEILKREVAEMTRRAAAQLDTRAERLERLIRAADERLAKLAAAAGAGEGVGAGTGDAPPQSPADEVSFAPAAGDRSSASAGGADVIDPSYVEIYTLCEQGLSIPDIAQRLRRPSGEVELILALRPRKHAVGASGE